MRTVLMPFTLWGCGPKRQQVGARTRFSVATAQGRFSCPARYGSQTEIVNDFEGDEVFSRDTRSSAPGGAVPSVRVRNFLQAVGRDDLLVKFFDRAERCRSDEELVRIAREYVADA